MQFEYMKHFHNLASTITLKLISMQGEKTHKEITGLKTHLCVSSFSPSSSVILELFEPPLNWNFLASHFEAVFVFVV